MTRDSPSRERTETTFFLRHVDTTIAQSSDLVLRLCIDLSTEQEGGWKFELPSLNGKAIAFERFTWQSLCEVVSQLITGVDLVDDEFATLMMRPEPVVFH